MRLLANLGGEEGRGLGKLPGPAARAAGYWTLLFPRGAELVERQALGVDEPAWPSDFDETTSAFPFLDEVDHWAWFHSEEAAELLGGALCTPEQVREVHDKAFAQELEDDAGSMPGWFTESALELEAPPSEPEVFLARLREISAALPPRQGGQLRMKPRLGSTGRGHWVLQPGEVSAEQVQQAVQRYAGKVVFEAELVRLADYSVQLFIEADGSLRLLGSLEQRIDGKGLFRGHRGEVDSRGRVRSASSFEEELREAAVMAAERAASRGYRGPCGIDAFSYRDPESDVPRLRAPVEFNARFTMGIVSIGLLRRWLREGKQRIGLAPGELRRFVMNFDGDRSDPDGSAHHSAIAPGLALSIEAAD